MRKFYLFAVILFSAGIFSAVAQQLPNAGFESWDSSEKPTSWDGSNIDTTYMSFPVNIVTVSQDNATPFAGTYSCRMTTYSIGFGLPSNPGFITLGKFWYTISPQNGGAKGGIPFNGRPDTLKGYFKNALQGSDKSTIFMESWQGFHATIIQQDTMTISTSHSSWTPFSMPLTYYNGGVPDSMNIIISCSDLYNQANIAANTAMTVDELSLVYGTVSIEGINFNENFAVWADAASETLFVRLNFPATERTVISLYNLSGQLVSTTVRDISASIESIALGGLNRGIYIVDVTTESGKRFSQKISLR